jgi:hypothetical protein
VSRSHRSKLNFEYRAGAHEEKSRVSVAFGAVVAAGLWRRQLIMGVLVQFLGRSARRYRQDQSPASPRQSGQLREARGTQACGQDGRQHGGTHPAALGASGVRQSEALAHRHVPWRAQTAPQALSRRIHLPVEPPAAYPDGVRQPARPGHPRAARLPPSLSTRTIGVPGFTMARGSRRARRGCTELTVDGGPTVRIRLPPAESQLRT